MKISIIGTGYVGLVSGVCLADRGHEVVCVDLQQEKVDRINQGLSPIHERGLDEVLKRNVGATFRATTNLRQAVMDTELSIIAVGTPYDGDRIDLTQIREASRQIGVALKDKSEFHVVVVKSTVVPGTTDSVVGPTLEEASGKKAGRDFGLGMNPEFLREGEAVEDFMRPDRIVAGGVDERSCRAILSIYDSFPEAAKVSVNPRTAEMIKYASNSLLATLISFSNEIGNLCASVGSVDVVDVLRGVHLDRRISVMMPGGQRVRPGITSYIEAGCGFGGSCFPKDVNALIAFGRDHGKPMGLLEQVMEINEAQPMQLIAMAEEHIGKLEGERVAVLGVAFKPGTDDVRESPAIKIIDELLRRGAQVSVYDPVVGEMTKSVLSDRLGLTIAGSLEECIGDARVSILVTRWKEFERLPAILKETGSDVLVIDGRRMLDKREIKSYTGIGLSSWLSFACMSNELIFPSALAML